MDSLVLSEGASLFDDSIYMEESSPFEKRHLQSVSQGSVVLSDGVSLKALRSSKDSSFQRFSREVLLSLETKEKLQSTLNTLAKFFVPLVVIVCGSHRVLLEEKISGG